MADIPAAIFAALGFYEVFHGQVLRAEERRAALPDRDEADRQEMELRRREPNLTLAELKAEAERIRRFRIAERDARNILHHELIAATNKLTEVYMGSMQVLNQLAALALPGAAYGGEIDPPVELMANMEEFNGHLKRIEEIHKNFLDAQERNQGAEEELRQIRAAPFVQDVTFATVAAREKAEELQALVELKRTELDTTVQRTAFWLRRVLTQFRAWIEDMDAVLEGDDDLREALDAIGDLPDIGNLPNAQAQPDGDLLEDNDNDNDNDNNLPDEILDNPQDVEDHPPVPEDLPDQQAVENSSSDDDNGELVLNDNQRKYLKRKQTFADQMREYVESKSDGSARWQEVLEYQITAENITHTKLRGFHYWRVRCPICDEKIRADPKIVFLNHLKAQHL